METHINIFGLHYFLWFAGLTSIYGYVSVYAEHYANASSTQYGLLNMILPFVTIVAKVYFCSLADRHRAYRTSFVWFLISSLIGFGSYGVLPFFLTPQPKELGLNVVTWSIICLITSVSTISMGVISCLSDAFAMNSSKKNNSSYGYIRVWGTIGWGVSSLVLAFINQTSKLPLLVPGLIMTIILLTTDIISVIFWPNNDDFKLDKEASDKNDQNIILPKLENRTSVDEEEKLNATQKPNNVYGTNNPIIEGSTLNASSRNTIEVTQESDPTLSDIGLQWLLFKEVAKRRKSLFRYLVLFTISGALMSLQWSYFFLYLMKIYEVDFTFISGLSMVVQSMVGELPFFILSKVIIQTIGRSHTLSLSIVSIGIRYILYRYLLPNSSMYFVVLTEAFQGPSFCLFYVVMTEVGLEYSDCEEALVYVVENGIIANDREQIQQLRPALRATMQSISSACYEGLGLGIGSIVGGLMIDYYGFEQLWLWSSIIAVMLGSANFLIDITGLPILVDKKPIVTPTISR